MEEKQMEHLYREEVAMWRNNLKKTILFIVLLGFLHFMMSACCANYDLKKDQISRLKVEYCSEGVDDYVIVSGIPFHSALVIKKIIISDLETSINIEAKQQMCGSGIGLPFYLKVKIRKDTKFVTLGEDKEIIWERNVEK